MDNFIMEKNIDEFLHEGWVGNNIGSVERRNFDEEEEYFHRV